jgi:TM2 domain-containing membrane protein YozV
MDKNILFSFPGIESDEMMFIQEAVNELNDEQKKNFVLLYQGRRKDPQTILICCIIGFLGVAGLQRFFLGQIGMGILYFFTAGLCFIGTILDIINYKKLTFEFNQKLIVECKYIALNLTL